MRVPRRRSALLAALALAACAAPARADDAGHADAAAGSTAAHATWDGAQIGVANVHLTVTRGGATTFDGDPWSGGDCAQGGCSLAPLGGSPLRVRDLDGDGSPEVLLDGFTGGAHCCELTEILRAGPAGDVRTERNWGDPGYRLRDLDRDGRPEFVTADDAFAYAFAAYAVSPLPPRVLSWRAGTFTDVTRRFPAVVRADLAQLRKDLRVLARHHLPRAGAIAAYTADLYLLGRAGEARAYLAAAPGGRRYHARVLKFLHQHGYR
ncbi:MAG: hypothetical protein ACXVSX_02745 [Solirubrobacteraceae bacterium]